MNYLYPPMDINQNIIREINYLKEKVSILEKRIITLENKEKNKYLEKDDNYYMI